MASPLRSAALVSALLLALGACGSDSSTTVHVKVGNPIDEPDRDPNLIVSVVVRDDDHQKEDVQPEAPVSGATRFEAVVEAEPLALPGSGHAEAEIAYLVDAQDGSARGIVIASPSGEMLARIEAAARSEPSWSPVRDRIVLAGRDGVYASDAQRGRGSGWSAPQRIALLEDVSAVTVGPPLGTTLEGEAGPFEVILAIAPAAPGATEDVFAILVDGEGRVTDPRNLTRSPDVRELDVAWLADGERIALLERTSVDSVVIRSIALDAARDAHVELSPAGDVLWTAPHETLGQIDAARTRALLAISAWTGADWDVLCIDARGATANYGSPALDEFAPSWSRDDAHLALEQRCTAAACAPAPLRILELEPPGPTEGCPSVIRESELGEAASAPAWRQ